MAAKRRPSAYTQAFTEQIHQQPASEPKTEEVTPPAQEPEPPALETSVNTNIHKAINTDTHITAKKKEEPEGETHKQTIIIKENLSRRVKVYVATHKGETIGSVYAKALEMFLDTMENQ